MIFNVVDVRRKNVIPIQHFSYHGCGELVVLRELSFLTMLVKIIVGSSPIIIHTHHRKSTCFLILYIRLVKVICRKKITHIHTFHNPIENYKFFFLFLIKKIGFDDVVYNSSHTMQSFSSLTSVSTFRGWSRDRVIENGVDMVALRKVIGEPVSQSLPQEKSSDLIWIGRVCEQKNIELFIQYLKTPRAKGLEVTIVCDRPDFVSNFMQIGEPCMANVRVFEFVEQKDLWTMMLATKVYVSSSRYEGYGNIIGEAVALGMQVVLPFIEPLTSLYPSTAFFYVPLDIDALSDSIDLAIAEERTLGPQTRSVHTMEAASKHLEMLYHEYA